MRSVKAQGIEVSRAISFCPLALSLDRERVLREHSALGLRRKRKADGTRQCLISPKTQPVGNGWLGG